MNMQFRNSIYEQGNRIYGIMDEIDEVSQSNCSDSEKLEKFNHIRDELNRIYEHSIALPEFLNLAKEKKKEDYDGYEVIPRTLTAWDKVQEKLSQSRRNLFGFSKSTTTATIQSNNLAMVRKLANNIYLFCS